MGSWEVGGKEMMNLGFLKRARRVTGALVVLALAAGVLAGTPQPARTEEPDEPILWGAYAQPRSGQSPKAAVEALENTIGRPLGAVRVFDLWNTPFPDTYTTWLRDSGHTIVLSVRAKRTNGTQIKWSDIANAAPGTTLYNEIVGWANAVKGFGAPIYFTFHHEPEAEVNLVNGTAPEFIAAWRKIVGIFGEQGASNARFLWIMTDYSFFVNPADRRSAPKWYPGDAYVDGIAGDAYNWYTCRPGVPIPWWSLQQIIEPMRQFGAAHPDEELWLAEFASVEDPAQPDRKAEWIDSARQLFQSPGWEQFRGVLYFHNAHATGSPCQWWIDSSTAAASAFTAMGADPYYGGDAPTTTTSSTTTSSTTTSSTTTTTIPSGQAQLLFVVSNPSALGAGDAAVRTRLLGAGYDVVTVDDDLATVAQAASADAVLLSSTTSTGRAAQFERVATPVVSWKPWSYDPLNMSGALADVDYGNALSVRTLAISEPQHPLAAGLSGTVTITSANQTMGWGTPGAAGDVVATVAGKPGLFTYGPGDAAGGWCPRPCLPHRVSLRPPGPDHLHRGRMGPLRQCGAMGGSRLSMT